MLLAHERQHQLRKPCQSEKVHLKLTPGLGNGDILNGTQISVSGIVDQHIYPTLGIDDAVDTVNH